MYNVLNINALTLFLSRTPRRLKTSCESASEEAGLAPRKTKIKIPFQFQDLSKTAYCFANLQKLCKSDVGKIYFLRTCLTGSLYPEKRLRDCELNLLSSIRQIRAAVF